MCVNNKTPHHALGLPDFSNSHPGIIYKLSIIVHSPFVSITFKDGKSVKIVLGCI